MRFPLLCSALGLGLLAGGRAWGQTEEIRPPFKLTWGESSDRIERILKNTKAVIVEKRTVEDREAWDVEGFTQPGLKRTVFYFRGGQLCEVELQYQRLDWDQAKYDEYMGQIRRSIEKRFGPGQLIARSTDPDPKSGGVQTVVGYKWAQGVTSIKLQYFSLQNGSDIFRTLSVHYRTD